MCVVVACSAGASHFLAPHSAAEGVVGVGGGRGGGEASVGAGE